jgi:hypothetical protein
MRKTKTLFLQLILFPLFAIGQIPQELTQYEIASQMGDLQPMKGIQTDHFLSIGNRFVVPKDLDGSMDLLVIGSDFAVKKEVRLFTKTAGLEGSFDRLSLFDGKVLATYYQYQKSGNCTYRYMVIDADGKKISEGVFMTFSSEDRNSLYKPGGSTMSQVEGWDKFSCTPVISLNKQKLAIFYRYPKHAWMETVQFGFRVLDNELKEVWNRNAEVKAKNFTWSFGDQILSDDGLIVGLMTGARVEGDIRYLSSHYFVVQEDDEAVEVQSLQFDQILGISNASVAQGPDGKVLLAGYYTNLPNPYETHGSFICELDNDDSDWELKGKFPHRSASIRNFSGSKNSHTDVKEMLPVDESFKALKIKKILTGESGEIYVIGERPMSPPIMECLIQKIGADYDLIHTISLRRKQFQFVIAGGDIDPFGISFLFSGGLLYFAYNDHGSNISKTDVQEYKTFSGSNGHNYVVKMHPDGSYEKRLVSSGFQRSGIILTNTTNLQDHNLIYVVTDKKEFRFVKVDLAKF